MEVRNCKNAIGLKEFDLEILPEEARRELLDFYNYLVDRYKDRLRQRIDVDKIARDIEKLSWEMGDKLYSSRGELHER